MIYSPPNGLDEANFAASSSNSVNKAFVYFGEDDDEDEHKADDSKHAGSANFMFTEGFKGPAGVGGQESPIFLNNNDEHEHMNDTSSFLNNYTADEVTKKQLD